jgi:phospholipase/carboxylesterase
MPTQSPPALDPNDPHAGQPVLHTGPAPEEARGTLIMIHGRGASAESILSLYPELGVAGLAALAPQAAGHTWYPYSFLAPVSQNQPYLDSALRKIDALVTDLISRGVPTGRIAILGFSQGACLTSEYVARHARRYGAVMALTGGLIGPPGTPRNYPGSLAETPAFLGTSDPDPHVPFERIQETAAVLNSMGAKVEVRRYPGMPHTINQEEIDVCRALLTNMIGGETGNQT